AVIGAALLLLISSLVGRAINYRRGAMMRRTEGGVTLSLQVNEITEGAELTYTLTNQSGGDIAVYNRVVPDTRMGERSAEDYVYSDVTGSTLELKKMALPLPKRVFMHYRPMPPHLTLLPNGQVLRERIRLRRPIRVYNPMREAELMANGGPFAIN